MVIKSKILSMIAVAVLVCFTFAVRPAGAVHDLGIFELDGNAIDSNGYATAPDDWDTLYNGQGSAAAITNEAGTPPLVIADPAPVTIFTQGGSKDINDISDWRYKDGSVPDKDDITNAYAAAYNHNNELVVYFGADRFANDGDAQMGFWFFQENVTLNPDGTFNGNHAVGDVLILANFTGGGTEVTIEILEWVGSGGDQKGGTLQLISSGSGNCASASAGSQYCAITNLVPETSPWPYTPKSGNPNKFPIASFFEGGANITQIFNGMTPCFASFLAETRSSSSVTAQLKDFVLGSFPVCGVKITKDCSAGTVNADQTGFVWTFSGTVKNTGMGTLYDVTVTDDQATPNDTSDDVTFDLGTLGPGATTSYGPATFTTTVVNPPTNGASVAAAIVAGGDKIVTDGPVYDECPKVQRDPHISVTKACQTGLAIMEPYVVVKISSSGQVCNPTGGTSGYDPVNLVSVTVTDDKGTIGDTSDDEIFNIGDLAAGACKGWGPSEYYPATVNSLTPSAAQFTDTVTAKGTAVLGFGDVEDSASDTCFLCPPCPD